LVQAGLPLNSLDAQQQTPVQVAQAHDQTSIVAHLHSNAHIASQRAGAGDAFFQAMADQRVVVAVKWYTTRLASNFSGRLGVCHSVLLVTVGGVGNTQEDYLIEKSLPDGNAPPRRDIENGIYVSHVPAHFSQQGTLWLSLLEGQIRPKIVVAKLRNVAVALGPYDLVSNNCHHSAKVVYNTCAAVPHQAKSMPNEVFTEVGRFITKAFVIVAASTPSASESTAAVAHPKRPQQQSSTVELMYDRGRSRLRHRVMTSSNTSANQHVFV